MKRLSIALLLVSCGSNQPEPRYPIDLAVTAVNAVDTALAVAIETAPLDPNQTAAWTKRVTAVETAAALVRAGGDLCPSIPALQEAATAASCEVCATLLVTLASEASCPQ